MNDEELYFIATKEVGDETRKPALWAKVMALSEGDQTKAKYLYIKVRVEQLVKYKNNKLTTSLENKFGTDYIPIAVFSKAKSIPEKKIIKMIQDGFYQGRTIEGLWYVSSSEIDGESATNETDSKKPPKKDRVALVVSSLYMIIPLFVLFSGW